MAVAAYTFFFTQIGKNLHVQRPVMPLVAFVQVDCDLYRHRIWHFTRDLLQKSAIRAARSRRVPNLQIVPLAQMFALAALVAHSQLLENFSGRRIVFEMRCENAVQGKVFKSVAQHFARRLRRVAP
jgi:hypothetical protein